MQNLNFAPELLAIGLACCLVGALASDQNCKGTCDEIVSVRSRPEPVTKPLPESVKVAPEWLRDMRNHD